MDQGRGGQALFNKLLGFSEPPRPGPKVAAEPAQAQDQPREMPDLSETQVVGGSMLGFTFRVAFWENLVNPEWGVGSTKFRALWFNLNLAGNAAQDSHIGIVSVPRDMISNIEIADRIIATMAWRALCRVAVTSATTQAQMLSLFSYTMLPDQRWKPYLYVPTTGGKLAKMRGDFWKSELTRCDQSWIWQGKNLGVDKTKEIFENISSGDNSFVADSRAAVVWRFNYIREQLEREIRGK